LNDVSENEDNNEEEEEGVAYEDEIEEEVMDDLDEVQIGSTTEANAELRSGSDILNSTSKFCKYLCYHITMIYLQVTRKLRLYVIWKRF